jgi:hypothetical protein
MKVTKRKAVINLSESTIDEEARAIDESIKVVEGVALLPDDKLRELQTALSQEQQRRYQTAVEKAKKGRYKRLMYVFKNRDKFLKLMDHYSTCSDENPINNDSVTDCAKCFLLTMEEWQVQSLDLSISLVFKDARGGL